MKKWMSACMGVALAATLSIGAMAANSTVKVNGTELKTKSYGDTYVPARAFAEADYGMAFWNPEKNTSTISLPDDKIEINCATLEIKVNGTAQSQKAVIPVDGITYIPVSVVKGLDGYAVTTAGTTMTVTTPAASDFVKMVYDLRKTADLTNLGRTTSYDMAEYYGFDVDKHYDKLVAFNGLNLQSSVLYVAKAKNTAEVKADFEARKQQLIETFTWYQPAQGDLAKKGQIVTSGDYVLMVISENNDAVVKAFQEGVKTLK